MHVIEQAVRGWPPSSWWSGRPRRVRVLQPYRACRWCRPGGLLGGSLPPGWPGRAEGRRGRCWRCKGTQLTRRLGAYHVHKVKLSLSRHGTNGGRTVSCRACTVLAVRAVPPRPSCPWSRSAGSRGSPHIVEVAIVSAACGALVVAACLALFRWAGRRDNRRLAAWRLSQAREVPVSAPACRMVTSAERPALGFRDLHIHLDGMPATEQVEVIRQAIDGRNS